MATKLFRKKPIATLIKDNQAGFSDVEPEEGPGLRKVLTVKDLTSLGIAAVIGAGIFSTIGTAAYNGGPGVSILFIITAITCGFSALCYAEFASRVPVSGSAYTYAYVAFGELIAWIIGWALILEYAIGNIVVAISWSGYFNNLLQGFGIHLPGWLTMDHTTASQRFEEASGLMASGKALDPTLTEAYNAWMAAPAMGDSKLFLNVPALFIVVIVTWLAYIGIKESKKSTNFMVALKLAVILFVIGFGFFHVNPDNWTPFLPNDFSGVLRGVGAVFYAYIGFDAISTTAEECENPQRDLPRGMIYSLLICTGLYILISLVLTGMVNYTELKVDDPLAFVFERINKPWISYIISVSAVVATTSVLLVFQLGQPRIWMSMSRDGLLPKSFSKVHRKYQTPSFSTIVTGLLVAIPCLFLDSALVTDLTSIGTLFAFALVCGGVLYLPKNKDHETTKSRFKIPYVNGKFIIPVLVLIAGFIFRDHIAGVLDFSAGWDTVKHNIPFMVFMLICIGFAWLTFKNNFSIIPVLGLLSCLYLMTEIPVKNWIVFTAWLIVGLVIYFSYGYRRSKLSRAGS